MAFIQTVPELLEIFHTTNSVEAKCAALVHFRSNFAKGKSPEGITEADFSALFKILVSTGDAKIQQEACCTLNLILLDQKYTKPSFFESVQQIDTKISKVRVFSILEKMEDNAVAVIANDPQIVNFYNACFQSIDVKTMQWLAPTFCTDNLQKLTSCEHKPLTENERLEEKIVLQSLNFLSRIFRRLEVLSSKQIQLCDSLVIDKVVTLAYMGLKHQREAALKVFQDAIKADIASRVRQMSPNTWIAFKKMLQDTFSPRMCLLVAACCPDWANLWNSSIEILGRDLHRGAGLINNLLSVEEKAFKSSDTNIRRQAFYSWKLLVDNFALDPLELSSARRIKLLCVPLIAKNSKTEVIAFAKFEVWWHLIVKVFNDLPKFVTSVLAPFLNFCFGPLGDTPLLSSTLDICASPGKRFPKTKLASLDALLQLLTAKEANYGVFAPVLEERLPHAVTTLTFQESYKTFTHSVFEALLILGQFDEKETPNRKRIGGLLWRSLISNIEETSDEIKVVIYKDVILVVTEITHHISNNPLIKNLLYDVILVSLAESAETFVFCDDTLANLITVLLNEMNLNEYKKDHCEAIKRLLLQIVKPNNMTTAPLIKLQLLGSVLKKLRNARPESSNTNMLVEMWCMLAEVSTKHMENCQQINEGDAAQHKFTTIEAILAYPVSYLFLDNLAQVKRVTELWGNMYKQFDLQADFEPTIKPNEIFIQTSNMLRDSLKKEKKCFSLLAGCLNSLISNINYQSLLGERNVPSIVPLINELIVAVFKESQFNSFEEVLKSLSALLITVFGQNMKKSIQYLEVVKPSIEFLLSQITSESIDKEIADTWDIVVTIFKGLNKHLTYDLLSSFQKCIALALCHTNSRIISQAQVILSLGSNLDEKASKLLRELGNFNKKLGDVEPKADAKPKQVKVTGSFLNRKSTSSPIPHSFVSPVTNKPKKQTPLPPDPNSQDYIVIKSDIKFDVNRLTEHQKETLKKRRDDIPALYNDLSQSGSQDSQELQKWFEKRQLNKADTSKKLSTNCDSNKENKVSLPESKPIAQPEASSKESTQIKEPASQTNVTESVTDIDKADSVAETSIAKKLDFESREEFPDNKEAEDENGEENEDLKIIPQPVSRARKRARSLGSKSTSEPEKKRGKRNIDDDETESQKRKKLNSSESSDNESIKSSENEEVLSKRVKSEISRLQIDMVRSVFEPLPNRRRSKLTDCVCKDPLCKKIHSPDGKGRLRSDVKPDVPRRSSRPPGDSLKKRARKNSKQEAEEEKRTNRKTLPKLEIFKGSEASEEKPSESNKDDSQLNGEELSVVENFQDSEEIVECSQDVNSKSKLVNRLSEKKLLVKIDKMNSKVRPEVQNPEPEKVELVDKVDKVEKVEKVEKIEKTESIEETKETVIDVDVTFMEVLENQSLSEVVEIKKPEASASVKSNLVHLSSPKGIVKRTSKLKGYPLQGRAAQMLGLVTKQGLMEKDAKVEDDAQKLLVQVIRKPESDNATNAKKGNSKETEKMGNPSGSRQEKIFNNMKSADYCVSPPPKLFGSLKNDGEKISPKVAKNSSDSLSFEKLMSNEKETGELSPTRDYQLPILEWSSANPPSLTASPSAGILKRHNQSLPEFPGEPEAMTPNKRKRVSFADPPVSQKMGYEVAIGESPHKMNRSTRGHSMRRDTPLRPRQNRLRMFQMDVEKVDKSEMSFEEPHEIEVEREKSDELVEIPDDMAFNEDTLMKIHEENACPESSTPVRVSGNKSQEIPIGEAPLKNMETEESKHQSAKLVEEIFGTQDDMFAAGDTSDDSLKTLNTAAEKKDNSVSLESIKFNSTNDSLSDTASLPKDASKNESLEDTVDVQNVSSFDSSDEAFCGKPIRCSTSTADAEQDTLPVTDSVFGSISQETQNSTQNVANLPKPEILDSTKPIFPSLLDCTEPVTSIIESLSNPLWIHHLSSCFASREIHSIGDLASLSEREINRIPVKGNPKKEFVKSVLARFESGRTRVAANNSEIVHLEKTPLEGTVAPAQTSAVYHENETSIEVPALSSTLGLRTTELMLTNEPQQGTSKSAIQSKKFKPQTSLKSVAVQMELADLLDEIDVNQVLESAARRCTPESLLAQYKAKMRHMPEYELEAETLRMLGLELKPNHNEVTLKSACKACGIDKVLLKLPDIFRGDKQFFAKVLSTYQKKIKVSDCIKALDENELKDALCEKCKSSEIAEMLSKSLKEEEEQGIVETISDPPTLNRILKRVPTDLLISHTIANDELIPSHIVLDIALQNNTDVAIAQSLNTQREEKKEGVFHKLWTPSSALTHVIKEASEAEMLEIIKTISLRLRPEKLLEAFKDSMNTENNSSEKVLLGLFKVISAKLNPDKLLDVFYECMKSKITSNDS